MNRLLLFILLTFPAIVSNAQEEKKSLVEIVHVTGLVNKPLTLDPATVAMLPVHHKPGFELRNDQGEVKRVVGPFKGILLADIIRKAGVTMAEPKGRGKYYIVVTASDNYQVVFGYDEVMYGNDIAAAYLLLEVDGKKSGTDKPFIMACPGDCAAAPRYIKMVKEIDVRKI